jgi:hypothetical protein
MTHLKTVKLSFFLKYVSIRYEVLKAVFIKAIAQWSLHKDCFVVYQIYGVIPSFVMLYDLND